MKPSKFDYYRPQTLEETLNLLANYGDEGKILAGGQSFIPILNMRMSEVDCLIDINNVKDLDYIKIEEDILKIGTLTRQRSLEQSDLVFDKLPLLRETCEFIGHQQTRNRGTVGGSVVHADPSAELPLVFLILGGKAIIQSEIETRETELNDFFLTYLTTDMMPDELLTSIHVPISDVPTGYAFEEISRRHGDFALVSAVCLMNRNISGKITDLRLAIGGVDAVPMLADEEDLKPLIGKHIEEEIIDEIAESVLEMAEPDGDLHASAEYRMHIAKVLIKKVMKKAYLRAERKEVPN
ncbi:FAD binding domain-containing protein [Salinicoccus halodurans]|uniref:Carbon-monoxide dehydrogenase medium subunit/2-furoyl-CoA dehydrogenase FAD binding subunit n=1 Tax=Salinicoccus halodurans TaxID=407035 RepID=A0A0F7HL41_9STAP|nr:FAD binding domain-containing protein [Salinicoccus halodurans]AKG73544.1 molybdopterin dehydrogenase [Salinicoccus halodurans]SFK52326.1 carbon-monoxide dehydrogenase medium subunit/2-furoyl-CoA dehydrogenase FAD binding subunit [Salinicoccus halodurans]